MDLTELMRDPGLALDPPTALDTAVRRRARVVRRRRRALSVALVVVGFAGAVGVVPGLMDRDSGSQIAGLTPQEDFGIKDASSEVVLLERVNKAAFVAYFDGAEPCIATIRIKRDRDCGPSVDPATRQPFPTVFPEVRVDERRFLAGTVSVPGPVTLLLDLEEGEPLVVTASSGRGFVLPVFHVELPDGAVPVRLRAVDPTGADVATRDLRPA